MNIKTSKRIFVKDLNANDRFCVPGQSTIYVCDSRQTMDNMTRVNYHVQGDGPGGYYTMAKVNLSSIDLITN